MSPDARSPADSRTQLVQWMSIQDANSAGFVHGELPVGIGYFAGAGSEPKLLGLAFAFERATGRRRPPAFLPSLELE